MLVKIEKDFYVDIDEIYMITKERSTILIYVKQNTDECKPFALNSRTKIAREFLEAVDGYLGLK